LPALIVHFFSEKEAEIKQLEEQQKQNDAEIKNLEKNEADVQEKIDFLKQELAQVQDQINQANENMKAIDQQIQFIDNYKIELEVKKKFYSTPPPLCLFQSLAYYLLN